MSSPSLFETPIDNRGLFADHYLEERFPYRDDVQELSEEADAAFKEVMAQYRSVAGEVNTWNEAQTEDRFVQPILKDVLGWARKVQPHVQRQGRAGRPDYALFTDEDRRKTAVDRAGDDETKVFDYADAVADAKYWGRPLDGPAPDPGREKTAEMRQNNPSFQIIDYVTLTGVDWGILTNGARWRLYYQEAPSRLETYFEVNLPEIFRLASGTEEDQETAHRAFRLFYSFFRADAHRPTVDGEKFVDIVYEASDTYAEALEDTLKERVFDHVFLELATGLYNDHQRRTDGEIENQDAVLDEVYRATLRLLYRLLFLLYAESRDLLPLDNPGYYDKSITRLAQRAKDEVASGRPLSERHPDFWNDLDGLFRTISEGDPAFEVPAYNGGLFRQGDDPNAFLDNREIGQRYFVRALVNLTAVNPEADPTGSYYTPHYIVEYIVEETLGPIVDERIEEFEAAMSEIMEMLDGHDLDDPGMQAKLDAPRQRALDAFLTVRVCDPAMGSGHFLVYAADYLAERFAQVLGRYPDHNPITQRLDDIRTSILEELDRQGVDTEGLEEDNRLRDTSLLKRLVMKRCIYGVDLNPMAVELAKLSLWLHSFTVGAPLSFLDHHLKAGNSLIGSAVDTVVEKIQADLFGNVRDEILRGTKFLQDAAFNTDATLADVDRSAKAFHTYQATMRPYKRLLDLWTAQYFGATKGRTLVRDYAREVIKAYKDGEGGVLDEFSDTVEVAERLSDQTHVFHWELEFPEVFYELDPPDDRDDPGFDAVIGNPPYVRMEQFKGLKNFLRNEYEVYAERTDLYGYFIEQALDLTARNHRIGLIVSNKWRRANYGEPIRDLIEETATARQVIDFGDLPVFNATTYPLILIAEAGRNVEAEGISARILHLDFDDLSDLVNEVGVPFTQEQLQEVGWAMLGNSGFDVLAKIKRESSRLVEYVGTSPLRGIVSGLNEAFIVDKETRDELVAADSRSKDILYLVRTGQDVRRYALEDPGTYLIYTTHGIDIDQYPAIEQYLRQFKERLEGRATDQAWYELQQPQEAYKEEFKQPKIINPDLAEKARFHLDHDGIFPTNKIYSLPADDAYLLAVLNSQLSNFYLESTSAQYRGDYLQLLGQYVEDIPIREITLTTGDDERAAHFDNLTNTYKTERAANLPPADTGLLDAVTDHLSANRAVVVHDLLAHLAKEMTQLKGERYTYNLDITDYVTEPADGVGVRDIGRYQPAASVTESLLADTTEEWNGLRIGTLSAEKNDTGDPHTLAVRATARFKPEGEREMWPDAVPDDAEPDQWDYVETDPLPVCTLHDCSTLEADLVAHWVEALNDTDAGFSGYRDTATKTISLLNRIYDIRFPNPSNSSTQNALKPFFDNVEEAEQLDEQITFTDQLIDDVVYRLYDLTEEEIAVVEDA